MTELGIPEVDGVEHGCVEREGASLWTLAERCPKIACNTFIAAGTEYP